MKDTKQNEEINDDVSFEKIPEEKTSFKKKDKNKIKSELEDCKKERQEYLDGWQRARAEMVNLKKQHLDEKKLFTSIGKEKMLNDLVPILDNFNAAFSSDSWENVDSNWRVGIEYIYNQFVDILKNNGIEEYGEKGEFADIEKYEILKEIESDQESGQIIKVVQKGYKQGEKILRPAKVEVAG